VKAPLDTELDLEEMLRLYGLGYGSTTIAERMGVTHETVQIAIRKAAADARQRNQEHVDAAFVQQDRALQHLHERCMEAVERAAADGRFDEKAVKCLILALDRRAKLLGLDRVKVAGGAGMYDWLKTAKPDELEAMAKRYGVSIPTPFAAS